MPGLLKGFWPVIATALLICGCVRQDAVECPPDGYGIVFFYPGNGTTDVFAAFIDTASVYFYDRDGNLVLRTLLPREELEVFQGIRPDLPPGEYTVVCWGNTGGFSRVTVSDPLSSARLFQSQWVDGETISDFDPLYFGRRDVTLGPDTGRTDTLEFVSAHINMAVHIEDYRRVITTRATGQGIIGIENVSVGYDFEMDLTPEISVMYPFWETDADEITSRFRLLRFSDDTDIRINIRGGDDAEVLATVVLRDFLEENGITVDGVNEITVPVYIIFDEDGFRVSVEPWNTSPVVPVPSTKVLFR